MYDLVLDAKTAAGMRLGTVFLPHEPRDADKIVRLRENMMRDGWHGRPVVLIDNSDHHIAVTGTHRLCAAQGLDNVIEAVYVPSDLTPDQMTALDQCGDDDDRLNWAVETATDRDDMTEIVAALRAEVDANNRLGE